MAGNVLEYVTPTLAGLIDNYSISVFSPEFMGTELLGLGVTTANVTNGANGFTHHPFILSAPFKVNQFFWVNGTTVDGDSDIAVYSEDGQNRLVRSGVTLNAGASSIQLVNITDYILPANARLWLSLGTSSATHQYVRATVTAPVADYIGIKTQASAWSTGAPSTITFAIGSNSCMWCGMTGASVF